MLPSISTKHEEKRPLIHRKISKPRTIEKHPKIKQLEHVSSQEVILDRCRICSKMYSNLILPKLLPCNHIICESCLQESLTATSLTCLLCKKHHEFSIEESGFLVSNKNIIRIFDDGDSFINVNEPNNIAIYDIVNENYKKTLSLIGNLLRNASTESIKKRNDPINRSVLIKEFPFKSPAKKQLSKVDEDLIISFEKSLEPFNLQLKNRNLEVNKYERLSESIILETKSKQYTIDMGKNVDSIFSLFTLLDQSDQSSFRSTEDTVSLKSNEDDMPHKTHSEEPLTIINDQLEYIRKLQHSIIPSTPLECSDDLPEKSFCYCAFDEGPLYNPIKLIEDDLDEVEYPACLIKKDDSLFMKRELIDGYYCRKLPADNTFLTTPLIEDCYECYKPFAAKDRDKLTDKEKKDMNAVYYCPKYRIGLCMRHGLEYKIKFGYLKLVGIVSSEDIRKMMVKKSKMLKPLLQSLLRAQYARRLDEEELMQKKNQ